MMKNPIIALLLGLFLNVFSLIYFDFRLFLWSLSFFILTGSMYVLFSPYRMDLFMILMSNLFFACFNYYIAELWNFMQMDESYTSPWMNLFHSFKKWFLRFIIMILLIFLIVGVIKNSNSIVEMSLKISAIVILAPTALFIIEYFISIFVSMICTALKLPSAE